MNSICRWTKRTLFSLGAGGLIYYAMDKNKKVTDIKNQKHIVTTAGQIFAVVFGRSVASHKYEVWRLRQRLRDSAQSLAMWQQKWIITTSVVSHNNMRRATSYGQLIAQPSPGDDERKESSRRLLEALPLRSNKGAFWYSQGALRLLLVNRVMDLVYASIGTAIDVTGPKGACGLWVPLAGMFASYYAIAGPDVTSNQAASMLASPSTDFIKRAWGMVTLPPIRWLTTEASRLFQNMSLIERVEIAGVPCLILSHAPVPSTRAAINRSRRQRSRASQHLGDIEEDSSSDSANSDDSKRSPISRRRSSFSYSNYNYEEKDVIFHVTGGGWFIHTTATDIPYLSEWSAATDSIVVVPEYDLLPEHQFPVALNQVTDVYCSLVSGESAPFLGFKTRKIALTGESAGGNLAVALMVKLSFDNLVDVDAIGAKIDEKRMRREGKCKDEIEHAGDREEDNEAAENEKCESEASDDVEVDFDAVGMKVDNERKGEREGRSEDAEENEGGGRTGVNVMFQLLMGQQPESLGP